MHAVNAGSHERQLKQALDAEGYTRTYVWEDGANVHYPDHTHAQDTAHIILRGQMVLAMKGRSASYRAGERVDVPAGMVHTATMGPQGCRYLIGERLPAQPPEDQ